MAHSWKLPMLTILADNVINPSNNIYRWKQISSRVAKNLNNVVYHIECNLRDDKVVSVGTRYYPEKDL